MQHETLTADGSEDGERPTAEECGQPLEAGKGKETTLP